LDTSLVSLASSSLAVAFEIEKLKRLRLDISSTRTAISTHRKVYCCCCYCCRLSRYNSTRSLPSRRRRSSSSRRRGDSPQNNSHGYLCRRSKISHTGGDLSTDSEINNAKEKKTNKEKKSEKCARLRIADVCFARRRASNKSPTERVNFFF